VKTVEEKLQDVRRGALPRVPRPAFLLVLLGFLCACGGQPPPAPAPKHGHASQGAVSLISAGGIGQWIKDNRGKAVFVNLWATWCPPCVAEMPQLNAFHKSMDPGRVSLLAVSVDDPSRMESTVAPFVKKHGLGFPVRVLDSTSPDELGAALGIEFSGAVPVTVLFSPAGELVRTWEGEVTSETLHAALAGVKY